MTSIAITTIITAIPMLMTTSKHRRSHAARGGARESEDAVQPSSIGTGRRSEAAALYRLMTWLSPAFPVGAFSYSSGIEWAVEAGDIGDAASLAGLAGIDARGRSADFATACFWPTPTGPRRRATRRRCGRSPSLLAAFVPSRERQLETSAQGRAFIDIARAAWNCDGPGPADCRVATAPSSIPSRSVWSAPRMRSRSRPRCMRSFTRWPRTGSPPARGLFRSGRPTASACWPCWSRSSSQRRNARWRHRSTISAARPFAPISPACGTRRSTRGCSGHE